MNEGTNHSSDNACNCTTCRLNSGIMNWHGGWGVIIARVVIILIVFWAGTEFGEMKALINQRYIDGPTMMRGYGYGGGDGYGPGMMYGYGPDTYYTASSTQQ